MEIIIDEFHYNTQRSLYFHIRRFFKYLKKKSYISLIFILFYFFVHRFIRKLSLLGLKRIWGGNQLLSARIIQIKKEENEEILRKIEVLNLILQENSVKTSELLKQYQLQIFEMFNLEQLRENLTQSSHLVDQRMALLESYKGEMFTYTCLWFFSKSILEILLQVKDVLKIKYMEKFIKKYQNTIVEVDKMTDYIINEFYDTLIHAGLKNLIDHIKKTLSLTLMPYKSGIIYTFADILGLLAQVEEKMLTMNTKDLDLPDDNKRRSGYCIKSLLFTKNKLPHKKITFTDFNVVSTELLEIEEEDQETHPEKPKNESVILFPKLKGLSVPKNTLDLLSIFNGDIASHKYFVDQECIERYIIMADRAARAERYRCYLQEIKEELDSEEFYSEEKDEILQEEPELQNSIEDNEKIGQTIEEARYYFALILKLFCGEIVDFLESSNLNIYIFYSLKYEFFSLKRKLSYNTKDENNNKKFLEEWLHAINLERLEKADNESEDKFLSNKEKEKKMKELLEETKEQIYKSLFLKTDEYEKLYKGEKRDKFKRTKKENILNYLVNYGVCD